MCGHAEDAVLVGEQHIHARGFHRVVAARAGIEEIFFLQHGVHGLPGLENIVHTVKARFDIGPRKIIREDRLEGGVAGDRDHRITDLEGLVMVDDVVSRFLARTPLGHGVGGYGDITILTDDGDSGHRVYWLI